MRCSFIIFVLSILLIASGAGAVIVGGTDSVPEFDGALTDTFHLNDIVRRFEWSVGLAVFGYDSAS